MKIANIVFISILLANLSSCATKRRPQSLKNDLIFTKKLEAIRAKYNLPALAAIIVNDKTVINVGVTGLRAIEAHEDVQIEDKFHLGSNTKSMTATLLAKMIEQGHFFWDDTIESAFPNLKVHTELKKVTLEQLLRHQGGVTGNIVSSYPKLWSEFWRMQTDNSINQTAQRALLASKVLADKPSFKVGAKSNYSNTGITLVGHAIENKMKEKYEELLQHSLFSKLDMNHCGFGAAGLPNRYDQPRGHIINKEKVISINPGPTSDNPDAIAPAGKVHCSIIDWGKYIQEHLNGARGTSKFLTTSTYKKLHNPLKKGSFALGWINLAPTWAKNDNQLFHNGSNTMNYAEMWISPKKNYAIAVVTNIANQNARSAVRKAVEDIAKDFLQK